MNMSAFLMKSIMKEFWTKAQTMKNLPTNIRSNSMRIALLYEFGGAYIDTDTISRQHVPTHWHNFISNGECLYFINQSKGRNSQF